MSDDALGLEVLSRFEQKYEKPEGVDLLDGGTLGLDLLIHVEGYDGLLFADCITRGARPGEVIRIGKEDVAAAFSQSLSPHQVGLQDLISLLELQDRMPERLAIIGVEPETVEMGVELSEPVRAALDEAVEAVARELRDWGFDVQPRAAVPDR